MSLINQVNLLIFQLFKVFKRVSMLKMLTEMLFDHYLPILIINYNL